MAKIKAVLSLLLLTGIHNAFAQSMDYDMVGVYLPVEYIESLERTKHNPASWAIAREGYENTVYIVDEYSIHASGRYDGQGLIYLWDLFNFKFEAVDGDVFLTDHKNNRFRKLPGDLYDHEDWREIIGNFIGGIVLGPLIKSGDIMLENDLVSFPALDNKTFRVEWQAFDPRQEKHLSFEGAADYSRLSLEIRPDEYVFYGYDYFINDIVWSVRVDETDVFPEKTDFYGVWVNDLDVKHILGANEWTFLSPNGNTYTMSDLAWTKKINYGPTASDYPKGYEITGTIVSIAYNGPTYLSVGNTSTACYCLHKTDKTKIAADNNPDYAAFFNKGSP